jgi:hypothetical protein
MTSRYWRASACSMMAMVVVALTPVHAQADTAPLAPVQNLTSQGDIGEITLSWTDPGNVDADGFVVCEQLGTTALTVPSDWCTENNIERSTSHSEGVLPPSQTLTYSVWPRDGTGNLGPARSITIHGTVATMATVPSTNQAATGIRLTGRLTDGLTSAPLPNAVVDVYADRPLLHPPEVGFSDEFVLVARIRTDESGSFVRDFPLRPGWDYQARYFGDTARVGNLSRLVPADGSSFIDLDSRDATFARSRTRVVTLVARVPAVRRGDRIAFQRLVNGHWKHVTTRALGTSRTVSLRPRIAKHSQPVYRAVLVQVGRTAQPSVPLKVQRR